MKKGSFDWKFKGLVSFLKVKMIGGPLTYLSRPPFPPNTSSPNFEIAIFFSVVDFQIEYVFVRRTLPQNPRGKGFKFFLEDI